MKDLEINLENYTNERHPTSTIITNLTAEDYQNRLKQKQTISSDRNSSSGCTLQEFCCSQSAKTKLRDIGSYSTSTSFTVLNNDYDSSITGKPNAIVHPIQRTDYTALPTNKHVRNGNLHLWGTQIASEPQTAIPTTTTQFNANFAEELNRRLRNLNIKTRRSLEWSRSKYSVQNGSNQETLNQRPLFITTVPRGIFLPPPKEVFLIPSQHKKSLYAYSSHPVVYQASLRHQKQHIYNTHTGGTKVKTINVTTTTGTTTTAAATTTTTTTTTTAKAISNCYKTVTSKSRVTLPKGRFQNVKYNNKADDINGSNGRNREDPIAINDKDKVMTIAIHNNNKNNSNSIHKQICKNNMREKCNRQSYVSVIGGDVDDNIGIHITKQQQRHQRQQQQSYHTKREIPPTEPYNDTISKENEDKNPLTNPLALLLDYNPFDKGAESKRRLSLRKRLGCQKKQKNFLTSHGTDRQRHNTKDNKLIEEITTRSPEIVLVDQSELFLEKPPLAPYVPFNVSVDASTEIADDELFHFEAEVQPIIEVLVDHTIDLSVIEVAHEKEISTIRRKMDVLLAQREVELAELRRLEAEDILLKAERTRRLRQEAIAKTLDEDRQQEVIAAKLLQGHIANVLPEILDSLEPAADADKKEKLMKSLCPWLSAEVATEVGQIINSREILTVIIKEIIKQRAEIYAGYQEKQPITETIDEEEYEICEIESNLAETETIQRCSPHI
uniref:Radial spoke head protein 3 homolog n=1 Tax=Glossina palpalis gambiensis TaxID=67801 RepID=A0A1B0BQ85_9MUSC